MKLGFFRMLRGFGLFILAVFSLIGLGVFGYFSLGWQSIPTSVPSNNQLYQPLFLDAAAHALQAMQQAQQQQQLPALTAAVGYRGQLIWTGAVGYADVAQGQAATERSQFRIGSTSKAVTATALARAVAAGQLDLDAPISSYHRALPNPLWQRFTVRQLMSHTAGLPGYEQNTDWLGAIRTLHKQHHYADVDDSLDLFDSAKLMYPAGEQFLYSSLDVNLASSVLQHAVKRPFLDYVATEVSMPLQLSSLKAAGEKDPAQVQFYQQRSDGQIKPHWPVDLSQKWAGGGMAASSQDLVRLGMAWLDPQFIPSHIQQQFWTKQRLNNGEMNPQNYALGWRVSQRNFFYCDEKNTLNKEIIWIHHGGVSDGAQSWLVIYPQYQLVLAMNTNTVKENYCDFAGQAAAIVRPFMQQIAPELFTNSL